MRTSVSSFLTRVLSVPPQKLRILTKSELARFAIGQADPIYQEVMDAKEAERLRISKTESLRRKSRSERICRALYVDGQAAGISVSRAEWFYIDAACKEAVLSARPPFSAEDFLDKETHRQGAVRNGL